jgi:hypothetical protein
MAESTEKISVQCECGARLKAPRSVIGRRAKCPTCKRVLIVSESAPESESAPAPAPAPAPAAAPAMPPAVMAVTPKPMPEAAPTAPSVPKVTETPAAVIPAESHAADQLGDVVEPVHIPVVVEDPVPAGSLFRGAALSALAALLGAGVWFAIARFTGYELSLIAWAVGLAAGLGMLLGRHRSSSAAGAIAGAMALGGIVLGKLAVFAIVTVPMLGVLASIEQMQFRERGIDPHAATVAQREAALDAARTELSTLDFRARQDRIQRYCAANGGTLGPVQTLAADDGAQLFFRTMFKPIDLLSAVLAIGSAFKVATLGGDVDRPARDDA